MLTTTYYRPIIARFLLFLFVGMLANGILFLHAHRLTDGTIIYHAHPFKAASKNPIQPNNHTQQELLWLDGISNALYTHVELFNWVAILVIAALCIRPQITITTFLWSRIHTAFRHRGPPCL